MGMVEYVLCSRIDELRGILSQDRQNVFLLSLSPGSLDPLIAALGTNLAHNHKKRKAPTVGALQFREVEKSDEHCAFALLDLKETLPFTLPNLATIRKVVLKPLLELLEVNQSRLVLYDEDLKVAKQLLLALCLCQVNLEPSEQQSVDGLVHYTILSDAVETLRLSHVDTQSVDVLRGADLEKAAQITMNSLLQRCNWEDVIPIDRQHFIVRLILAERRDRAQPKHPLLRHMRTQNASSIATTEITATRTALSVDFRDTGRKEEQGLRVFEFFSGIGGMRLGLPADVQITQITAFDLSSVANHVYTHNFHLRPDPLIHPLPCTSQPSRHSSILRNVSVQSLSLQYLDGAADIWTLSPPCQPHTLTRGALQKDMQDPRSSGLLHLLTCLSQMQCPPRFICLENVAGFVGSQMHALWIQALQQRGYTHRELLLSPETSAQLPNSRLRYYCIARLEGAKEGEVRGKKSAGADDAQGAAQTEDVQDVDGKEPEDRDDDEEDDDEEDVDEEVEIQKVAGLEVGQEGSGKKKRRVLKVGGKEIMYAGHIHTRLPSTSTTPTTASLAVRSIADTIGASLLHRYHVLSQDESVVEGRQLLVRNDLLMSSWAPQHLSVIDRPAQTQRSFCFTKGYGKKVDRSAVPASGSEASESEQREDAEVFDRGLLPQGVYNDRIRLFHPDELLRLFGFPATFALPSDLSLRQRFNCIGNSVNVAVVRNVLRCLFDDALWTLLGRQEGEDEHEARGASEERSGDS